MDVERNTCLDTDDMTVSVTSSLIDAQAPAHDDAVEHEDGRAVLREAVQVTSHGRVVSSAVQERPVSIHGEPTRARAAAAALAAHVDAEDEVEEKGDKRRNRQGKRHPDGVVSLRLPPIDIQYRVS